MKNTILITLFLTLTMTRIHGQDIETKKVSYAKTLIDVPKDYDSKDAYSIESSLFSGKKYLLKGDSKLKYKILAFGTIDEQPLILNLGFKENPMIDQEFDDLIKKFIQFKNKVNSQKKQH